MLHKSRENLYTALDVGTTTTRAVVARVDTSGTLDILATGFSPSRGVQKGIVVGVDETRECIRAAVDDARRTLGRTLPQAWLGVTGSHVQSYNTSTSTELDPWEEAVSQEDVDRVVLSSAPKVVPQRQVLHVIPRAYALDGQHSSRKPVGLYGRRLDVESHVVLGDASSVENVMKAVTRAGLQVRALVLKPLASAEAVLTADERQMGVLLVDIGGGTSEMALFQQGNIWHTSVLPVGGYQFTNDLCLAYGIPFPTAEAIKLQHGLALPENVGQGETVEFLEPDRDASRRVPRRQVCQYLNDRAKELVRLIIYQVQRAGLNRLPQGGVVLTGGAAKMPGLADLVHRLWGVPVRVGMPRDTLGLPPHLCDPSFSTSVGILVWGISHPHPQPLPKGHAPNGSRIRRLIPWFPHPASARGSSISA